MNTPSLYPAVADLNMSPYLTRITFREWVLWNLLFGGNLVIVDGYWYGSDYIHADLLEKSTSSVLLSALDQGLVEPCFRVEVGGSFRRGFEVLQDQGILGPTRDTEKIVDILENARNRGFEQYRHRLWPKRLVGRGLLDEIRAAFDKDDQPSWSSGARATWRATKRWRTELVDIAVERTADGTLRRGELLEVVARDAGWTGPHKVANATLAIEGADRSKRRLLKTYIFWVNQCYQRNQANMFALWSGALSGRGYEQLVLLPPDTPEVPIDGIRMVETTVLVPSIRFLSALPMSRVLSVRKSPEASEYFRAQHAWQALPGPTQRATLGSALAAYAERLRTDYRQEAQRHMVAMVFGSVEDVAANRKFLASLAVKLLSLVPGVGTATTLVDIALSAIWHMDIAKDTILRTKSIRLSLRRGRKHVLASRNTQLTEKFR